MRILKNQNILQRQSENYIKGELSNVASAIQTQMILVEYFSLNPDKSSLLDGLKSIEDYIGPQSTAVYDHIPNIPIAGIDNLVSQATFDEEIGYEEDYSSSGMTLPNTIIPKEYDCFIIQHADVEAIYFVTRTTQVTVRSNPFTEIQFRLFSRNPETVKQLRRQVNEEYVTTVTAIGLDKSLVIKKSAYYEIKHHVENYLQLVDLYSYLFYDRQKAAFVFDGLPGVDGGGMCMGYQSEQDAQDNSQNEIMSYIADHGMTLKGGTISAPKDLKGLKNGDVINDRGDKFYVVNGDPIVIPAYVPYWMVRNHHDIYGNPNDMPGANVVSCKNQCETCVNKNCPNACCTVWSGGTQDPSISDPHANIVRQVFVDITIWKMMFDFGIVIYDDVVTYANNNYKTTVDRMYTDSPDLYLDETSYKRSIIYKLLTRDKRSLAEFIHPQVWDADPRISKFQGSHIYYLERYGNKRDCCLNAAYYNIWDPEFLYRITHNDPYPEIDHPEEVIDCQTGNPVYMTYPFDVSLRNLIIKGYNNVPIDWDAITLNAEHTIETYTLLPVIIGYYKDYIRTLQR